MDYLQKFHRIPPRLSSAGRLFSLNINATIDYAFHHGHHRHYRPDRLHAKQLNLFSKYTYRG